MSKTPVSRINETPVVLTHAPAGNIEPRLEIDGEVTRRIRQHARTHLKTEVCGVLIGPRTDGTSNAIQIHASIEAFHAAQAGTHVTFTQDAWQEIYRVKDELYPDDRIAGWYHSHPGFGVFLSEHDMFIQENFFSSPDQVAWVYDPHTDEEGCFGWVGGKVHRLSTLALSDHNGDGVERTPKKLESSLSFEEEEDDPVEARPEKRQKAPVPRWLRWMANILSYSAAIVLGFALSYFFFPRIFAIAQDPITGDIVLRDARELLPYLEQHGGRIPAELLRRPDPPPATPQPKEGKGR